jgi:GNAT superfamily N-acetyltransferase
MIVWSVVVRVRALWPGWASLDDDDPPPGEELFRCADDVARAVRLGARPDGVAVVRHAWVDARMRGTGIGRALYELAAWESRKGWGIALSADKCFYSGETSESAERVWASMAASPRVAASGKVAWWRSPAAPMIVSDVDVSARAPMVLRGARLRPAVRLTHVAIGKPFEARAFEGMMTDDGDIIVGNGALYGVRVRHKDITRDEHATVSAAEAKRWRV